jgi:hypothetical protein
MAGCMWGERAPLLLCLASRIDYSCRQGGLLRLLPASKLGQPASLSVREQSFVAWLRENTPWLLVAWLLMFFLLSHWPVLGIQNWGHLTCLSRFKFEFIMCFTV